VVTILMATPMATCRLSGTVAEHEKCAVARWSDGGSKQTRTADPLLVRQVLYQLSYAPGSLPHIRSRQD
jgi:hypothetical protein